MFQEKTSQNLSINLGHREVGLGKEALQMIILLKQHLTLTTSSCSDVMST